MGSNWSCPCAERDAVKCRIFLSSKTNFQDKSLPRISVDIHSVTPEKFEKELIKPQTEYVLSSISKHPKSERCLFIYQ